MAENLGVWVDHRTAILVHILPEGEQIEQIDSGVEKHVREAGGSRSSTPYGPQDISAGNRHKRKRTQQLNRYYDELIERLEKADKFVILGPGEAKGELEKRIANKQLRQRLQGVESADKMTRPQLAAKVRSYFQNLEAT